MLMGFVEKFKNWFSDEEETEVEVKKISKPSEEPKKDAKKPIVLDNPLENTKDIKKEVIEEREISKVEPTFKFPIPVYEEDDFIVEETKSANALKLENQNLKEKAVKEEAMKKEVPEERTFKPSPIISPIYGILDKNYKKDEILSKKENNGKKAVRSFEQPTRSLDIDSVRRKALGGFDNVEDTLMFTRTEKLKVKESEIEINNYSEDDTMRVSVEEVKIEKIDKFKDNEEWFDDIKDKSEKESGDTDEILINNIKNVNNSKEEINIEDDLFSLIDSMYNEKEEEEE